MNHLPAKTTNFFGDDTFFFGRLFRYTTFRLAAFDFNSCKNSNFNGYAYSKDDGYTEFKICICNG